MSSRDTSAWNCVEVAMRVGLWRASFSVVAGITYYALPSAALAALADRATSVTDEVQRAVKAARERDLEKGRR
jgi:hypothetical protein